MIGKRGESFQGALQYNSDFSDLRLFSWMRQSSRLFLVLLLLQSLFNWVMPLKYTKAWEMNRRKQSKQTSKKANKQMNKTREKLRVAKNVIVVFSKQILSFLLILFVRSKFFRRFNKKGTKCWYHLPNSITPDLCKIVFWKELKTWKFRRNDSFLVVNVKFWIKCRKSCHPRNWNSKRMKENQGQFPALLLKYFIWES